MTSAPESPPATALLPEPPAATPPAWPPALPPEAQRIERLFRHCTQAGVVNPLMHLVLQYRMNKP